jgi:hypothetical protein
MLQGNPEGFKSDIPTDIQEILIAYIHALYREGRQGYSATVREIHEEVIIRKLDTNPSYVSVLKFDEIRNGGVEFLLRVTRVLEVSNNDGKADEVQEEGGQGEDEGSGGDNTA